MQDADKTPEQLIQELVTLRQHCAALQQARIELESRVAERTAELQRPQERFEKAFQASPDAIIIASMDGRYINVNPSFQRLAGDSRDEVIGRTTHEVDRWVNPADRATVARLFREQGAVYDFEARFWTKSGTLREVLLSVEQIELDGAPCALAIAHDVTERRQLERELLESSEGERRRIGYDLHDSLGQHLTGIAFLSKALAQRLKARHSAEAAEAAQHGQAQHITITLAVLPEGFTLMVHDDGVGFPAVVTARHGMGLRIMHHRACMIGATLAVQQGTHGGTCVICTLDNPAAISVDQTPSGAHLLSPLLAGEG